MRIQQHNEEKSYQICHKMYLYLLLIPVIVQDEGKSKKIYNDTLADPCGCSLDHCLAVQLESSQ